MRANDTTLSYEEIASQLMYNPDTGALIWKRHYFKSKVGTVAGARGSGGYLVIQLNKKPCKAHRLAFWLMTGHAPSECIDHINGQGDDNRWVNLREATHAQNMRNTTNARKNSTSGYKGVSYYKPMKKWQAVIRVNGKLKHLGYFQEPEAAHREYISAAKRLHGSFANL